MRHAAAVLQLFALASPAVADEVAALVSALKGEVRVSGPAAPRPLELFDWLPPGASLETAAGASLTLAFANGSRYELGPLARATVATDGLQKTAGPVKALAAVPKLPRLVALAADERVGAQAGAVRVRAAQIGGLYPHGGAMALADAAALRFRPLPGVTRYRVEIETRDGERVLQTESDGSSAVPVPAGLLKAGAVYYWRVRALEGSGLTPASEELLRTVSEEAAASRAALRAAVAGSSDASSLSLLAAVDRSLGLLIEAEGGLEAALAAAPQDAGLRKALERAKREVSGEKSP
jgi:hypothetical protein